MTTAHETVDRYLQIWNQRDPAARHAAVRRVFSDACSYAGCGSRRRLRESQGAAAILLVMSRG